MASKDHEPNCIFCKIIRAEIPSFRIFEDEDVIIFMDVYPVSPGHLLIVPKRHAQRMEELPNWVCGRMFERAQRVLIAFQGTLLEADGYNLLLSNGKAAGQEVGHVHLHIIPRFYGSVPTKAQSSASLPLPAGPLKEGSPVGMRSVSSSPEDLAQHAQILREKFSL